MNISVETKEFINKNKQLINEEKFTTLLDKAYDNTVSIFEIQLLLHKAGIKYKTMSRTTRGSIYRTLAYVFSDSGLLQLAKKMGYYWSFDYTSRKFFRMVYDKNGKKIEKADSEDFAKYLYNQIIELAASGMDAVFNALWNENVDIHEDPAIVYLMDNPKTDSKQIIKLFRMKPNIEVTI
mgnify:CR=1 FL=1